MRVHLTSTCQKAFLLLAILAVTQPALAAEHTYQFHAWGSWAIVSQKGSNYDAVRSGTASPGGKFDGVFSGKWFKDHGAGVAMLDFGNGDTLAYEHYVEVDPATGLLIGFEIVTGGTGKFEGATGLWQSVGVYGEIPGTGTFEYVGTLTY